MISNVEQPYPLIYLREADGERYCVAVNPSAKKVTAKTDLPVILSSAKHLCVFMTHTGKSRLRCGAVVKEFAVGAGGKGGGSDTQAQVIFSSLDTMRNFILIAQASV